MKKSIYTFKILCAALITAGITLYISSCKKDNSSSTPSLASTTVTEADAAQFTTDAISPATGGLDDQLVSTAALYTSVPLGCGVEKDTTIVKSSSSGASPSFNYTLAWNFKLNCNGIAPINVAFNYTGKGVYDGPRMSATDTSSAQLVLAGSSSGYVLTANYTRVGVATSKIAKQYNFSTTLNILSTNINVDKTTNEITSGIATVTIVATATNGKSFTFGGKLTFLGNKKGSLVLNSGTTYAISWS
jgi:hypothetical protein